TVAGADQMIGVIAAHVPHGLALLEMPRLHIADADRIVGIYFDMIIGEEVLGNVETGDDARDPLRECVRADGAQGDVLRRWPEIDLDRIGEDRAEELPVAGVNGHRIAMNMLGYLNAVEQKLQSFTISHDRSPSAPSAAGSG